MTHPHPPTADPAPEPEPLPRTPQPLTLQDHAAAARERLPPGVWDFIQGGSGSERAPAAHHARFDHWALRPRVQAQARAADPAVTLLGDRLAAPLAVAPMAYHELAHPVGESGTARAAGRAGVPMVVATFAGQSIEAIAAAATGPLWLQLYWLRRREVTADLVRRAAAAGYRALVLTVDAPRGGRRPRDVRTSFTPPPHIRPVNIEAYVPPAGAPGAGARFDAPVTWADLAWLRSRTLLPLVLKGVCTARDALTALDHGVDAVIVPHHGGRPDSAAAGLASLPGIAAAVGARVPVLLDGGVRCGADIAKALALGARAVLVGRPVLWGLAHGGEAGAAAVLRCLRAEFEEVMTLSGRPTPADFTPDAVTRRLPGP